MNFTKVSFYFTQPSDTFQAPIASNKKALSQNVSSPIIAIDGAPAERPSPTRVALYMVLCCVISRYGGIRASIRNALISLDPSLVLCSLRNCPNSEAINHVVTMASPPIIHLGGSPSADIQSIDPKPFCNPSPRP